MRLWEMRIKMDVSQINGERAYALVKELAYVREAGTEGERRAAEALKQKISALGITPEEETFSFQTTHAEASFCVVEPWEKTYTVTGAGNTAETPEGGLEAEFVYVGDADEISLSFAKNKIVMGNGAVRKDLYEKLEAAGAVGMIGVTGTPIDVGVDRVPSPSKLRGVHEPKLAGANLHCLDAAELVEQGARKVRLAVKQHREERTSANIVARVQGTEFPEEIITLTAHYDSVPQGPGAYDNMSGSAVILELLTYFAAHPAKRTLEFIWFGAEEAGLCGSRAYTKQHEQELGSHRFNMNIDLAGQTIGGNSIGVTGDAAIGAVIQYLAAQAGIGTRVVQGICGSDSNSFAAKGIPAMTMNRDGFGMHTHYDTIDFISSWSLRQSAVLYASIAEQIANIGILPFSSKIPENLQKELENYFSD